MSQPDAHTLGAAALAAALLLVGCFFLPGPTPVAADEEGWLSNYQDALAVAKEEGRPILLVFR